LEALTRDLLAPIREPSIKKTRVRPIPWLVRLMRYYFIIVGRLLPGLAAKQALQLFSKPRSRYSTKVYNHLVARSCEFSVQSNSLEIQGHIWDNLGPTVLLVHGWESSGLHLGSLIEPLWTMGFKVVIFDGPAHGKSQGTHTNLPDFSEGIRQVIKYIGPVDHMIAHSFGGFAGVYAASHFKQEISLDKMVLISVPNKLTNVISSFTQFFKIPEKVNMGMHRLIKKTFHTDPKEIETALMGQRMHVKDILVIHDRYDDILPFFHSREISHSLSNAWLLETENLGHSRILKNQLVISRIEQFLTL